MTNEDMNIKIQNATLDGKGNKGSCRELAEYINHEDKERAEAGKEPIPYRTPSGLKVTTEEVIDKIDRNHAHLSKKDDKFYHIVIAPSEKEIDAMGQTEAEQYWNGIKLVRAISDEYARNFDREGIENADDLVMYWKPHFTRGEDGELQFHIHGIISRNSKKVGGKTFKLSPLTNHRNTKDGPVKGGFDRIGFYQRCERIFDKLFHYERTIAETFAYNNAQKHGTLSEKAEQSRLLAKEKVAGLKDALTESLSRRRGSIKAQNDIEELAALLEMDNASLAKDNSNTLENAIDLAGFQNTVTHIFSVSPSLESLRLNLIAEGANCYVKTSQDGVEDLVFVKGGKKLLGKDILDTSQHKSVLRTWQKLTGQIPAYTIRAQNAADLEEKKAEEMTEKISQVTTCLKIGRR